jgi:DNA polymerase I-like protein with 3'-5' exonuclease and polymerase domains
VNEIEQLYQKLPHFLRDPRPDIYHSGKYLVLDVETTNIDKGSPHNKDNSLIMTQWKVGPDHPSYDGKVHICVQNEYKQSRLIEDVEKADFIVAHFSKFEWGWLLRMGLDPLDTLLYCTLIGDYVMHGNLPHDQSLEGALKRRGMPGKLSNVAKMIKAGICPSTMPLASLKRYGAQDIRVTEALFLQQRQEIDALGLMPVTFVRNIFTPVLYDLEQNGLHLDAEDVEKELSNANQLILDTEAELYELVGRFNPKSPKQKRELIFNQLKFKPAKDYLGHPLLTPKGQELQKSGEDFEIANYLATDAEAMDKMVAKTKKQKKFKELYGILNKEKDKVSKVLSKMYDCVSETDDDILSVVFNQTRTKTHRLSSTGKEYKIQGQNINRNFKYLISPRNKGWGIGEIDQGQLEFRSAAFQAQCEVAIQAILEDFDVHSDTASILNKVPLERFLEAKEAKEQWALDMRQEAKSDTFKPLYGGSSGTELQKSYYQHFREKYWGVANAQENWKQEVLNTGQLRISSGLIFHWPDTVVERSGYVRNSTNICNFPVQSFATADIVPIGTVYIWYLMKVAKLLSFGINSVHDSFVMEIYPPERELLAKITVKGFTDFTLDFLQKVYKLHFNVPLEAELKFGSRWGKGDL